MSAGKVYNITPYLEFHPGGVSELMRGAGKDSTDLFDEVSQCSISCLPLVFIYNLILSLLCHFCDIC